MLRVVVPVLLLCSTQGVLSQESRPFPHNRLRHFYFSQAEEFLASDKPIPDLLPQFPGLDGGAFGHWGQNPAENSIDTTLNSVDSGNVICSRILHFGRTSQKGVAISISDGPTGIHAVFDPLRLCFTDSWQGEFVVRGSGRFGVHDGARAGGQRLIDFTGAGWKLPPSLETRYLGFYRNARDVVFAYQIGDATILDRLWQHHGALVRTIQVAGALPPDVMLQPCPGPVRAAPSQPHKYTEAVIANNGNAVTVRIHGLPEESRLITSEKVLSLDTGNQSNVTMHLQFAVGEGSAESLGNPSVDRAAFVSPEIMTHGGHGQWVQKLSKTTGTTGRDSSAFAIDTLTIPYGTDNAFGTPMRLAGVGCFDDGSVAVSTLLGDVWVVAGVDDGLHELTWQRVAAGLYQPLGLVIQHGKIIVGGNDQVTRLHDLNGDGETDFYECITNEYPTTGGHDFATSLQQDALGRLYWATASGDFGLTRLTEGGQPESLGNGLRNSNGIGVSQDGRITLATVQEGTWTPGTAIFEVRDGSFHGHRGPQEGHGKYGYDLPLCFVPRGVDNSAGEICFLPDDDRLGPLSGKIVGSSYGNCDHYLILREELNGTVQGGVVPLPGEFLSGACRFSFSKADGSLYVAGTEGWQSYAQQNGCLQRLRFTGKPLHLPVAVDVRNNGLLIHCNTNIDPASVTKKNVFCQQWNYLFSGAYGSPEYSVKQEGRQGHDYVPVRSVHLLPDQKTLFVEIPQLHPVMQFHFHMKLQTADGTPFTPDAYCSIYELGDQFTDFPGYQLIAKRPWPEFPLAEKYDQDPRLVEQDAYGTNFGWVSGATKISLNAVTGLQYEPRRLRVLPGEKVALTFHNTDPSMPHNVVIVEDDKVESFADQSMVLATNPRAIATHYVPQDPAEICFSPILNPGDQYTVYFEAPKESGRYRFLCTYPGHSKVMRGTLYVQPADVPLPAEEESARRFVRMWTMGDLAADVTSLADRNTDQGRQVFHQAGCIKCHQIGNEGRKFGPEMADAVKRHRGSQLLKQILEPSAEINKQYQTWLVVKADGQIITGMKHAEDADSLTLLPNPLVPTMTVRIDRAEIEELVPSKQSTMPNGLLMTFTKDEILDLLAFIESAAP